MGPSYSSETLGEQFGGSQTAWDCSIKLAGNGGFRCSDALLQLSWILLAYASGKWALLAARCFGFRQTHLQECRMLTLTIFCSLTVAFSASAAASGAAAVFLSSIPWNCLWWPAAGIAFICRDPVTRKLYILVGQERRRGHPWCFPYGGADRKDRGNRHRTACREACEETCYALGLPDNLYNEHFRGQDPPRW